MEHDLGVREGFVIDLLGLDVDDWSFVIKTFGLLEASVNSTVGGALRRPEIDSTVAALPFREVDRQIGLEARRIGCMAVRPDCAANARVDYERLRIHGYPTGLAD